MVNEKDFWQEFEFYQSEALPWMQKHEKWWDFHLGQHWPEDIAKQLDARGQAPLTINKGRSLIEDKIAIVAASDPKWELTPVFPNGINDEDDTEIAWFILRHIWNYSNGIMQHLDAQTMRAVRGVGYLGVFVDELADYGRKEVEIESLHPSMVLWPPTTHKWDYSDAHKCYVAVQISEDIAKIEHPDVNFDKVGRSSLYVLSTDRRHNDEQTGQQDVSSQGAKYVWKIKEYKQVVHKCASVEDIDTKTRYIIWDFEEDWNEKKLEQLGASFMKQPRIHYTERLGNHIGIVVNESILPTSIIPIIPMPCVHTGTPYPLSDTAFLTDLSLEKDKRRSIALYHAMLVVGGKWLLQAGSYDEGEWDKNMAKPNAKLEYYKGFEKPVFVMPGEIPNAFFALEEKNDQDMREVVGISAFQQGMTQDMPDTVGQTLALDKFGQRRHLVQSIPVDVALSKVGQVALDFGLAIWDNEKLLEITDNDDNKLSLTINKEFVGTDGELSRLRDTTGIRMNVKIKQGSTLFKNEMARANYLLQLFDRQIVDDRVVIDAIPNEVIRKKKELLERKGMYEMMQKQMQQLMQQLEQAGQSIQEYDKLIENMRKEMINLRVDANVQNASTRFEADKKIALTRTQDVERDTRHRSRQILSDLERTRRVLTQELGRIRKEKINENRRSENRNKVDSGRKS